MRTVRGIFLLVVLSVIPFFSTSGQSNDLPFQHSACDNGIDLTGQTVTFYHLINPLDQMEYVGQDGKTAASATNPPLIVIEG